MSSHRADPTTSDQARSADRGPRADTLGEPENRRVKTPSEGSPVLSRPLARLRQTVGNRELTVLIALLVASAGVAIFATLAEHATNADPLAFDRSVLMALRVPGEPANPIGPGWLEELARDVTALGGMGVLGLWTVAFAGFLFLDKKPHAAWLVLGTVIGGIALSFFLKNVIARPRPDLVPHSARVFTASFPSAHSMLSAVTYLTLGSIAARMRGSWLIRFYWLALAVLVVLAVGCSRVYLGVHWPTDVLAGWAVGAAWALACWSVARWLQQRGDVESDPT